MRRHPEGSALAAAALQLGLSPAGSSDDAMVAAVQPLLERVATNSQLEDSRVSRAWDFYETPEVRFPARQYSAAFASAKLVLGRREVVGQDPKIITEPSSASEQKAWELLSSFAGGPEGQVELLDRIGTYFVVPGDMILVGANDPARMTEHKFAKWDVWSTTEVRWDGQRVHIQTSPIQDRFEQMPDYIRHVRVWNRHPRRGWESDSPVLAALTVLDLVGLYDDRLAAEAISRIIGAGVWMIPQGMKLPTSTGDPAGGTPNDFLRLLMDVAAMAIKDRRSAAAMVPVLVEAAAEDIQAAKDGLIDFSTNFDERIGDLQERAIRRWATGVDLPAEVMLGLSSATHWNASLITEDKVQSFIIPSLRRMVGNLTWGWLRPALEQFGVVDNSLCLWFDPAGIKTRVDLGDEAQWAHDRFMIGDEETKTATGLHKIDAPKDEELKRQMLLHMAKMKPETVPYVLQELGIPVTHMPPVATPGTSPAGDTFPSPAGDGRQGPQAAQERDGAPDVSGPGRAATLGTKGK